MLNGLSGPVQSGPCQSYLKTDQTVSFENGLKKTNDVNGSSTTSKII
ncbi:12196_t:CDS:2 [Entrophospora sp. SA101]|nr:12196_t:CDS:2 [Entrophospora sp. SA101]